MVLSCYGWAEASCSGVWDDGFEDVMTAHTRAYVLLDFISYLIKALTASLAVRSSWKERKVDRVVEGESAPRKVT